MMPVSYPLLPRITKAGNDMSRTMSLDWNLVRDEWVNRRLTGEQLALKDLAAERELSYETLRKRAAADCWQAHLGRLQARISARVAEKTEIDHVEIRLGLLDLKSRCELLAQDMIDMFGERVAHEVRKSVEDRTWHPSASDVAKLASAAARLAEVGGGLPKHHDPLQEGAHQEVILNREEQRIAAGRALAAARYGEKHGLFDLLPGGKGDSGDKG